MNDINCSWGRNVPRSGQSRNCFTTDSNIAIVNPKTVALQVEGVFCYMTADSNWF